MAGLNPQMYEVQPHSLRIELTALAYQNQPCYYTCHDVIRPFPVEFVVSKELEHLRYVLRA